LTPRRTAAEAARLGQNEADEALAATDAAMAALWAERDGLAETVEALRTANARAAVERGGLIADLAAVRRDLTAAERRAAAAEAAREAAAASLSQVRNETREATAAAAAMREQAAADVATARAEATAAQTVAEETKRTAAAETL
jgi:colicin import membrane protein